MAMVENATFVNDRKEVVDNGASGLNSPWKKPVEKSADSPVMGEKTWPALSDVQGAKTAEVSNFDSQVKQISDGHKKPNGGGSGNSSHKHGQPRYHRGGPKRNQNCGPPFPGSVVRHVYYPQGVPAMPPIPGHAYGYPPMPAPFPLGKSGSQIPMNAFGPSQNLQPPVRGDQPVNAPKYSVGRIPNPAEGGVPGGYMYGRWQRPKGGIMMQQNMAPGAYIRPAFFRPGPIIRGPAFPGPVHMHYRPMPSPGLIPAPYFHGFAPERVHPLACGLPPELLALRGKIVEQIEYYFSNENLLTDRYLISQMDDQGWVPISVIADFKRVKRMCTDTRFILDALRCSTSVEVQGNMLRKCDTTSKCPVVSESDSEVENNLPREERTDSATKESDSKADISSSDNHTFDASVDNAVVTSVEIDCSAANVDKLSNGFRAPL